MILLTLLMFAFKDFPLVIGTLSMQEVLQTLFFFIPLPYQFCWPIMPDINVIINRDGNNYIYMMIVLIVVWLC